MFIQIQIEINFLFGPLKQKKLINLMNWITKSFFQIILIKIYNKKLED